MSDYPPMPCGEACNPPDSGIEASADQHAVPPRRKRWEPRTVEEFLDEGRPGDRLFIREDGSFSLVDSRDHANTILAVLEKGYSGETYLRDGPPSLNGTFVEEKGILVPLKSSLSVPPGTMIGLSRDFTVVLPEDGGPPPEDLPPYERRLASLGAGETVVLGRIDRSITNQYVSRQHCRVTRQEDGSYRILDGMPSISGCVVRQPGDSERPVDGWLSLPPGTEVTMGQLGRFVVPHPPTMGASFAETMGNNFAHAKTIDVASRRASSGALRPEIERERLRVSVEQAMVMAEFLDKGLDLMRSAFDSFPATDSPEEVKRAIQESQQVLAYFTNEGALRIAQACGFRLEETHFAVLCDLEPGSIAKNLDLIRVRPWFDSDLTIAPTVMGIPLCFDAQSATWIDPETGRISRSASIEEMRAASEYSREACLCMAEEWAHAYQHILGKCVSKKGALIEAIFDGVGDVLEHDVAELLREQQIPLSDRYLARYGRERLLELLTGIQTESDSARVTREIAARGSDCAFTIGRSADISIEIPEPDESELFGDISGRHCTVRVESNEFLVTDHSHLGTFFTDMNGFWRGIRHETARVPRGSRIRLGPFYEIELTGAQ